MRRVILHRAPGQSLFVVILAMAAMFMVIGLGIDGGLLYAHRRLMQNTADAACLAAAETLSRGQTTATAQSSAVAVIQQNLGPTGPGTGANAPGTLIYTDIARVYSNNSNANDGSGTGLTRGIEISGPNVRVALSSPAFTYFVRLLGQTEYTVAARARCNASAGGGGSPFAVARYRAYNNSSATTPTSGLSTDSPMPTSGVVVRDVLRQANQSTLTTGWPNWGTTSYPGTPGPPATGLFSDANPAATLASPGFAVPIAGQNATANVAGGNGFRGPVLLDLRNLTGSPELYNGITAGQAAASSNKDFVTSNIANGYDGPFIPPGTQLGFVNGVSTGQVVSPFDLRYNVGDIISVLIYNGTIYGNTNFASNFESGADEERLTRNVPGFTGNFPANCNIDGNTVNGVGGTNFSSGYAYSGSVSDNDNSVNLNPIQVDMRVRPTSSGVNQNTAYSSNFRMRAFASVNGVARNQMQVNWGNGWQNISTGGAPSGTSASFGANSTAPLGQAISLQIQQSQTGTCTVTVPDPLNPLLTISQDYTLPLRPVSGALAMYVEAEDINTGQRRGRYVLLDQSAASTDFHAYMPGLISYLPSTAPDTIEQEVVMQRVRTTGNSGRIRAGQVTTQFAWFDSSMNQMTTPPAGLTPSLTEQGSRDLLRVAVDATAATNVRYYLRIQVTNSGHTHWMWYHVHIREALNNSIDSYVYTLGYANFRITAIETGGQPTIWGEAVSGLLLPTSYADLTGGVIAGMQARLLPWD